LFLLEATNLEIYGEIYGEKFTERFLVFF